MTSDLGSHWRLASSFSSAPLLNGISCPTDLSCVAVGSTDRPSDRYPVAYPFSTSSNALAFVSSDGGDSWTQVSVGGTPGDHATVVSCASALDCVAGGYNATGPDQASALAFATSDCGHTWTRSAIPGTTDYGGWATGVSCPTVSECWLSLYRGQIDATTDGGQSWSVSRPAPANSGTPYFVNSVSCPDTTHCLATNARTTDGGQTWISTDVPFAQGIGPAVCTSDSVCLAVSNSGAPGEVTAHSSDFGSTWHYDRSPENNFEVTTVMNGLACPGSGLCLAVGNPGPTGATSGVARKSL